METKKSLEIVAEAFQELAAVVNSRNPKVTVKQFSDACSRFSGLFGILDTSFKFAKTDYVGKINDLATASRSISTLEVMIDKDIEAGCVKKVGSHTRNLLKVKQGLEMIKVMSEELLATEGDDSLKDAAIKAYNQVLFPHHQYNIQKACATGLNSLPAKSLVLFMIGETEQTVNIHLQSYVTASTPVIAYLDKLFLSKNLGIDWSTAEGREFIRTKCVGTSGYIVPEYATTGKATRKVDIHSFGVILMELLTSQEAIDEKRSEDDTFFVNWFSNERTPS